MVKDDLPAPNGQPGSQSHSTPDYELGQHLPPSASHLTVREMLKPLTADGASTCGSLLRPFVKEHNSRRDGLG